MGAGDRLAMLLLLLMPLHVFSCGCTHSQNPADIRMVHNPVAFFVGVQKAGTTALFQLITAIAKPDISTIFPYDDSSFAYVIRAKEPNILNKVDLSAEALGHYMSAGGQNRLLLDFTPDYAEVPTATCRIAKYFSNYKVVYVVRDPAARALSAWVMKSFKQGLHNGLRPAQWNWTAMLQEINEELMHLSAANCSFGLDRQYPLSSTEQLALDWGNCFACHFPEESACSACSTCSTRPVCTHKFFGLLRMGLYAPQLAWLLHVLDRQNILVLSFYDVVFDTARALKNISDFLSLNVSHISNELSVKHQHQYVDAEERKSLCQLPDFIRVMKRLYQLFERPTIMFKQVLQSHGLLSASLERGLNHIEYPCHDPAASPHG
jgi:hypothetical protein